MVKVIVRTQTVTSQVNLDLHSVLHLICGLTITVRISWSRQWGKQSLSSSFSLLCKHPFSSCGVSRKPNVDLNIFRPHVIRCSLVSLALVRHTSPEFCRFRCNLAEQAELFRVVREGHPIPESTCWTSPIVIQPVEKRPFLVKWKKACVSMETRPRTRKRLRERIPEVSPILPFLLPVMLHLWQHAFLAFGEEFPGWKFKIELKSFVWRPSEQIYFFANSCATPKRWQPYVSVLWHGELFKVREYETRALRPNSLINVKEVASGATWEEEIQCRERRCPQKLPVTPSAFNETAGKHWTMEDFGMTWWKCQATTGQLSYLFHRHKIQTACMFSHFRFKAHGVYKIKLRGISFYTAGPVSIFAGPEALTVSKWQTILHTQNRDKHGYNLGVTFSSTLRWAEHIDCIIYNASRKLGVLRRLRRTLTPAVLLDIYTTCIRPTLEYANLVTSIWAAIPTHTSRAV